MTWVDGLGHVGYLWVVLGNILLTGKNYWGFAARMLGDLIWMYIGFDLRMTSIWIWGIVFVIVDIRGYVKWKMLDKNGELRTIFGK